MPLYGARRRECPSLLISGKLVAECYWFVCFPCWVGLSHRLIRMGHLPYPFLPTLDHYIIVNLKWQYGLIQNHNQTPFKHHQVVVLLLHAFQLHIFYLVNLMLWHTIRCSGTCRGMTIASLVMQTFMVSCADLRRCSSLEITMIVLYMDPIAIKQDNLFCMQYLLFDCLLWLQMLRPKQTLIQVMTNYLISWWYEDNFWFSFNKS